MTENWRTINLANWESRVPVHTGPGGYDRTSFDDPAYLSNVVRYDLPRLGRLDGLDVVHLQCHVGTDPLGEVMVSSPDHPGEYLLATQRDRLPLTYTLQAVKDHGTRS